MNWFERKSSKPQGHERAAIAHRVTQDLARAENLAVMVAKSRASSVVDVVDLLAGMYIYDWERLGRYWSEPEQIESFLQNMCQISPQRWHHWMETYDRKQHDERKAGLQRILRSRTRGKGDAPEAAPIYSSELASVLRSAAEMAPHHDQVDGRSIPILTCECVLLCIARINESELAHRLKASGLDLGNLEKDARFPKHAPLKGGAE
jgi:hypothetical protein